MAKYGVYQGKIKKKSTYVSKNTRKQPRKRRVTTYSRGGKEWELKKLERETKKSVQKANERLRSLERRYKRGTWASKRLENRLESSNLKVWKNGRIKLRKNMNKTQLQAVEKASRNFLLSDTSRKSGIKKRVVSVKDGIREILSDPSRVLTDNDTEFFYSMLEDKDFNSLNEDNQYASTLWACMDDAISFQDSEDTFLMRLENYIGIDMQDLDKREQATRLYQKYIL